ncbi:MAG: hypothetical protein AAGF57_19880 [Pseudomonadota bacterium]
MSKYLSLFISTLFAIFMAASDLAVAQQSITKGPCSKGDTCDYNGIKMNNNSEGFVVLQATCRDESGQNSPPNHTICSSNDLFDLDCKTQSNNADYGVCKCTFQNAKPEAKGGISINCCLNNAPEC